ncbi:transmembrane emp24 domain-containing protein 10 [Takifugu rubripes]|nr:transmembrane emp24 domain-containing protein 10 [Takifugu rubripes]|eukprot:XP_003962677.1 PREDICTED: transmembrane emp24 domain-containing protein 10 [Takifugu rubripes]
MARVYALLLIPVLSDIGFAINFHLPVNSVKCLYEDTQENVLFAGEYELSDEPRTTTDLKIIDSKGFLLYIRQNATKGRFSFTTEKQDKFDLCFYSRSPMGSGKVPDQMVKLNVKSGVEAQDRKGTENWEKLTPLEAKMKEIEQLAQSIAESSVFFMKRKEEMESTNASTNSRVLFLSIISMACLSALALWQVFYLKRFFKTRKLIE